jgi:hypothetical protein
MLRSVTLIIFFISLGIGVFGEPVPALIRHLLNQKKEIAYIAGTCRNLVPEGMLEPQLRSEGQKLIFNRGRLYVNIDGTGRLYRVGIVNDSLSFTRVDSTFFLGDNFASFSFSSGSKIYSYGGYGFWRNHGLVRYYDTVFNQWEVLKTSREIKRSPKSLTWIDSSGRELYICKVWVVNDANQDSAHSTLIKNKVFKLSLASGHWMELGDLKVEFVIDTKTVLNSPWGGILRNNEFEIWLYDLKSNMYSKASGNVLGDLRKAFKNWELKSYYFIGPTLYYGNWSENTLDSINLSRANFLDTGQMVYKPGSSSVISNTILKYLIAAGLGGLFIYLINFWRKPGGKAMPNSKNNGSNSSFGGERGSTFNELEKSLIRLILDKSSEGEVVSIDEINRVLGLSGKNEAIQKKTRSEVINGINGKWYVLHGDSTVLIDRKRSDFDKRSYEYFITGTWTDAIVGHLSEG